MKVLVTGGCGFIGSSVVRRLLAEPDVTVGVLDNLSYSANPETLKPLSNHPNFKFYRGDICDAAIVGEVIDAFGPTAVMHLAAESHVDRSIDEPAAFVQTNVVGTQILLDRSLDYWKKLSGAGREDFRFHHISTDEVFGSLGEEGFFTEATRYDPRSPYSASKAASDHLVRAWHYTYGLPIVLTNCSNNYGPYQFPEKLIPLIILRAIADDALPVYGDGKNVRDWLFVDDHADALWLALTKGKVGETYAIGGRAERRNIDVVTAIAAILDELRPRTRSYKDLITHVTDRPGHDRRYAIDSSKATLELGWRSRTSFSEGLRQTVQWYLDNESWWRPIVEGQYRLGRLGV